MEYNLPYFGPIDLTNVQSRRYRTTCDFANNQIKLDLNFDDKQIDPGQAELIKTFLLRIAEWDKQNLRYIQREFSDKTGETIVYINFFIEELDGAGEWNTIGEMEDGLPKEDQLLKKLRLIRVGLYLDFKRGNGLHGINQVLAVKTNSDGSLRAIDWES